MNDAELIARLEAAEAGSRELSDEVLVALGWRCEEEEWIGRLGIIKVWYRPNGEVVRIGCRPSPTESVDDALGLVPEGLIWSLGIDGVGPSAMIGEEFPGEYAIARQWYAVVDSAATPALALCVAVLRAREDHALAKKLFEELHKANIRENEDDV